MYLFILFPFIILLEFLMYELNFKTAENACMNISWLISRLLWVSETPQSVHENNILSINWQSSNLLILFPGCYLMILSLSVLILWLTWNKNLCSLWSNWPKITHSISYFLNSSRPIVKRLPRLFLYLLQME